MEQQEIFSERVRAGKRVYFFDVKSTKAGDYYVTITESKRNLDDTYTKHKLFLYKEDFEKFSEGLKSVIGYIKSKQTVEERRYTPPPAQTENKDKNAGAAKPEEKPKDKNEDETFDDLLKF